MFEGLKARYGRWQRFNRTYAELVGLSDRELADIGIARADIGRLAREAVK